MAIFPNLYVPDERDLRFASTGSNFNPRNILYIYPKGIYSVEPVFEIFAFPRSKSGIFDLNSNKNYHFSKVSQPYTRYYPVRRNKLTGLRRVTGSG
jgi:hypothetical protein